LNTFIVAGKKMQKLFFRGVFMKYKQEQAACGKICISEAFPA
jgi:hypothetical protein